MSERWDIYPFAVTWYEDGLPLVSTGAVPARSKEEAVGIVHSFGEEQGKKFEQVVVGNPVEDRILDSIGCPRRHLRAV